ACSEQNFPVPATWDGLPVAGDWASAPEGEVGSDPLLMLLGGGETFVVGAFWAEPTLMPAISAAVAAAIRRTLIFISCVWTPPSCAEPPLRRVVPAGRATQRKYRWRGCARRH